MRPQRMIRPDTAFSLSPAKGRKRPRVQDTDHLKFIRGLPCIVTGKRGTVQAAHIRYADAKFGKRGLGIGEKSDDKWAVPLSADLHEDQHKHGDERGWWEAKGVDPVAVAAALYISSGDEDMAEIILRNARPAERNQP